MTTTPDRQSQELIVFLESPASYPHRPTEVCVIQTHISWVFIASPFVFKVKKPVNLGFLDFSTLEKRHYFCQREIELNRRLCPEIYLDAVPIYEAASSFSFKPRGKTVEYAVQMRELPHDYFLIELLEKNLVGEKEINRVISTLHRFYQAESPTAEIEQWGTPEKLKISTDEFAFQAMNFDFEGRADLGNLFLRNAARELGDAGMLRIANFYKGYRAVVRGKVESIQATEKETTNRQEHEKQAARYFRLALRYTIASSEPLVIVVIGRVGTGKSTIAKRLAGELDWPVFSSDEIRKTLAGVPLAQRTPPDLRAKIYSAQKTQRTYRKLLEDGFAAIGCSRGRRPRPRQSHNGVILDATFSRRALRRFLRDECKKANVSFQFVELEADPHEIKRRLRARDEETAETSDARLEDCQKLSAAYEAPSELAPGLIRVSRTTSISDAVKTILLCLAERQVVGTNRRAVRQS